MEEIIYNKIYARANGQGIVTHIFSEAFEQPQVGDICIDSMNTDRHGANAYQVYDENGIANYGILNGNLVIRDKSIDLYQMKLNSYPSLVDSKIRKQYSISDELAILRQRDSKPTEYATYNSYCEQCKAEAKRELNI